tara:strand:- start:2228 stop:2509 length:282 start_codon:yes stop_codon:yes gene_type:complete
MLNAYLEAGAVGCVIILFGYMILNLMKSQRSQNEDLDQIRQAIAKSETKMGNVESIVLKLVDRWNRSDEKREDFWRDMSDDIAYLKGRTNGKN